MTYVSLQFGQLAANLDRMRDRMPDLPKSAILISRLILHLGRGMSAMLEQGIRPFGLSEAEFRVLAMLFSMEDGVGHPTELGAQVSQSPANMSRISDALVDRNLITRVSSLHDRRKMVLRITEPGEQLVRQLLPPMYEPLREMFIDFSDEELDRLILQMTRLIEKLDSAVSQAGAERAE